MHPSKLLFVFAFAVLLCSSETLSQIINIPDDYQSIQEGINAAQNGDTILVSEGEYFENINFRGKGVVVASRFIIDENIEHIYETIINGSQSTEKDTGSCAILLSGEDSSAQLIGFTLTGGTGTSFVFGGSAAIFREGGAIIMDRSSAVIKHNLIIDNEAKVISGVQGGGGGGISSMYGNPSILNNVIIKNTATYAAGMVLNWSSGTIKNNVIAENFGGGQYGTAGLMIWNSDPWTVLVENNTIVNNHSTSVAGGISIEQTSATLRNNIIWGNTQQSGQQVTGYSNSVFEYCDTEESYSGTGNISLQPNFLEKGYMLNEQSPCIDSGNPEVDYNDKENQNARGNALYPSLGNLRNDIGTYGGPGASFLPDSSSLINGLQNNLEELPKLNYLEQNYPNPFNPTTRISFFLSKNGLVELSIYDVLGNKLKTLVKEEKGSGNYNLVFDASDLPSGIYFVNLNFDNKRYSKKMCLLK